jgi:predicted DNA-binding transcriptional regulator AlpA
MKQLISEQEVSTEFGIPVKTLQKWRCAGGGPPFAKLGRSVRYRPADIETFIEAHLRTSTSQYAD